MLTFLHTHVAMFAYFASSLYFLCLAWGLHRVSPFYQRMTAISSTSRYPALDGLRGFLAFGVFFHHALIAYYQQTTGFWDAPPLEFYILLGHVGFGLFFIMTGFLFWQKALQGERFKPLPFYKARFKRLAPAYFFAIALIVAAIALPFGELSVFNLTLKDARNVLLFKGPHSTGGIFGVYWTLAWEWKFYLLLPLLALLSRRWLAWVLPVLVLWHIAHKPSHIFLVHFVVGALVAEVTVRYPRFLERLKPYANWIGVAALLYLFTHYPVGHGYPQSALMGVFFLCVVAGGNWWGLFTSRPALLLGTISYSLYLQHCIVLYVVVRAVSAFYVPVASLSVSQYFILVPLEGTLAILLAMFSYRYVEYPFMNVRTKLRA